MGYPLAEIETNEFREERAEASILNSFART
jgi:hypothetical protein